MGILNPPAPFSLDYRGRQCGGCNLPFDCLDSALAYAAARHATFAAVEDSRKVTRTFARIDGRYNWRETIAPHTSENN